MSGSAFDFDDKTFFADTVAVNCSGNTGTVKDPGAGRGDKIFFKISAAGKRFFLSGSKEYFQRGVRNILLFYFAQSTDDRRYSVFVVSAEDGISV